MAEQPEREPQARLTTRERLLIYRRMTTLSVRYAWLWLRLKRLEGRLKIREWMLRREDNPPVIKTVRQLDEERQARERGE